MHLSKSFSTQKLAQCDLPSEYDTTYEAIKGLDLGQDHALKTWWSHR